MRRTLATGIALLLSTMSSSALAQSWGSLANSGFSGQAPRAIYFFSGEGKCRSDPASTRGDGVGITALCNPYAYGPYSGANSHVFTFLPTDQGGNLLWHSNAASRVNTVQAMVNANANVIVMSAWVGNDPGANPPEWTMYAPMQTSPVSNDELFDAAVGKNVTIMPALDGIDFAGHFPPAGSTWLEANPIVITLRALIQRYITQPAHAQWPSELTKIYDHSGSPRYAIQIVNAASNSSMNGLQFASMLDSLADLVSTGLSTKIGFTIDPSTCSLPPGYTCGYSPTPTTNIGVPFPTFGSSTSVLAIQGLYRDRYYPGERNLSPVYDEQSGMCGTVTSYPTPRLSDREVWKQADIQAWVNSGVPTYLDVSTGYDARYVFGTSATFGDNSDYYDDGFRNHVALMKGTGVKGIVFNTWNGYTEGTVAVPSYRVASRFVSTACSTTAPTSGNSAQQSSVVTTDGSRANNVQLSWLTDLFSSDPTFCSVPYYVNLGATKYLVYGSICEQWKVMGGIDSFGPPINSESDTVGHTYSGYCSAASHGSNPCPLPDGTGGRFNTFSQGTKAIYWGPQTGAHEIYGAIYQEYARQYFDEGFLGLPTSGQQPTTYWCQGGQYNSFQGGFIDWCPVAIDWAGKCPHGNVCAHAT